uniref:Uncharacterized protein n=1 Tax=Pithovirus LCPAC401 TaxID=2506595 RepID=A0A481Z9V6_9VIRU|nr:MAG: hypothetical protein LCPAC401_00440 [Pithovirus LCPAC401]
MNVYVVISESIKFETSVDVYYNYDDAFKEAKDQMLMEIDRVYGKDSHDDNGVEFQEYSNLLYDDGSISVQYMTIEIIEKEVR